MFVEEIAESRSRESEGLLENKSLALCLVLLHPPPTKGLNIIVMLP